MNGIDKDLDLDRLLEWQTEIENDFARECRYYQHWKEIVRLMIELKSYDDECDSQLELDF